MTAEKKDDSPVDVRPGGGRIQDLVRRHRRTGRRYGGGLVVLGAEGPVVQLLLHVVRFRGGLDVHERHGGAHATAAQRHLFLRSRQYFNALHASIPVAKKKNTRPLLLAVFGPGNKTRKCKPLFDILKTNYGNGY